MRSEHVDEYNHDPWANGYDENVRKESDPIRTGYDATLKWVIREARITGETRVLDLGSGTGNLGARIDTCRSLTCVDVSDRMTALARTKLAHLSSVTYVNEDLLAFCCAGSERFDRIVSTYAIHHLTEAEKMTLVGRLPECLSEDGVVVVGDLMLSSASEEGAAIARYRRAGRDDVAGSIDEEFFWYVDSATRAFEDAGFGVDVKRFSDLSWGIAARKGG